MKGERGKGNAPGDRVSLSSSERRAPRSLGALVALLLLALAPLAPRAGAGDEQVGAATPEAPVFSTWARPVEVDAAATAWLIRRFVAPSARFVFEPTGTLRMPGTPFDVPAAEDSRRGNRTVLEYWTRKHKLEDPALERLIRVVHDIEINVWQEKATPEAAGVEAVFLGLNHLHPQSAACMERGIEIVEALYREFSRQLRPTSPSR